MTHEMLITAAKPAKIERWRIEPRSLLRRRSILVPNMIFWNFDLADASDFYCSKLAWLSVRDALSFAIDGDENPRRRFWFSPKQLPYLKRIERLTSLTLTTKRSQRAISRPPPARSSLRVDLVQAAVRFALRLRTVEISLPGIRYLIFELNLMIGPSTANDPKPR
jgi:hypothetical protein